MVNKVYFKDGHSEDILWYTIVKSILGEEVKFHTKTGTYFFRYEIEGIDVHSGMVEFLCGHKIPRWYKLDDNLEWVEIFNVIDHITICESKE